MYSLPHVMLSLDKIYCAAMTPCNRCSFFPFSERYPCSDGLDRINSRVVRLFISTFFFPISSLFVLSHSHSPSLLFSILPIPSFPWSLSRSLFLYWVSRREGGVSLESIQPSWEHSILWPRNFLYFRSLMIGF